MPERTAPRLFCTVMDERPETSQHWAVLLSVLLVKLGLSSVTLSGADIDLANAGSDGLTMHLEPNGDLTIGLDHSETTQN